MRKHTVTTLIVGIVAVLLSGCIETKEEYTLNPDGTGKVVLETFIPVEVYTSNRLDEGEKARVTKNVVKNILEGSSGIDVWNDVIFAMTDDSRISFKGTAYFKDFSKLNFILEGWDEFGFTFYKDENGQMVLEQQDETVDEGKDKKQSRPAKLSEEEITRKIEKKKGEYQQAKNMQAMFLSGMKIEKTFHLPGKLTEYTNFKKDANDVISFTLDGVKLLEAIDELFMDDNWWREQMRKGDDLDKKEMGYTLNEKIFGEKGLFRAVITGNMKPLFNYEAEVAKARKNFPKLLEKLEQSDIEKTVSSDKEEELKIIEGGKVSVTGKLIPGWSDGKKNLTYKLYLEEEIPTNINILKFNGGELEKANADNGKDLLPEKDRYREISFPSLSDDKSTAKFYINLDSSVKNVSGIREATGTLECVVGEKLRKVNLGIMEFKAGVKGNKFGSVITAMGNDLKEGKISGGLKLQLNVPYYSIKSVSFYDTDGKEVIISRQSWSGSHSGEDGESIFEYACEGGFPQKGSIIVEAFDVQRCKIPFKISNVSLKR